MNKLVTPCVIVANSDDCITRLLKWCNEHFEDIVIVKSDSIDNTDKVIDDNIGHARLYYKKMPPSFSEQKSYCRSLAKNDWHLVIDADELIAFDKFDQLINIYKERVEALIFPRYNLQVDEEHYTMYGFPDLQIRLMHKDVKVENKSAHESYLPKTSIQIENIPIIHWGHIRDEKHMINKADIRVNMGEQYLKDDVVDGSKIKLNNKWYIERNKNFEKKIEKLDQKYIDYINKYK